MKQFLSYKHFKTFSAPKLNADGTVAVGNDGFPIYIDEIPVTDEEGNIILYPMTKKQCLDIARILAGPDVSLYTLNWVYDVDRSQESGYLFLLAPDEPTGKKLGNFAASDLRRQPRCKRGQDEAEYDPRGRERHVSHSIWIDQFRPHRFPYIGDSHRRSGQRKDGKR